MRRGFCAILLALLAASSSGCTSGGPFVIRDASFSAQELCDTGWSIKIEQAGEDSIRTDPPLPVKELLFCNGSVHEFVRVVDLNGYTFYSDDKEPLRFQVDRENGYRYLSGMGHVVDPDGKVTNFLSSGPSPKPEDS
jgi:hypothetical protein